MRRPPQKPLTTAAEAVARADGFENRIYLDPIFKGRLPGRRADEIGPAVAGCR